MARLGITYVEVAQAAEQLVAQGKPPTVENIRHITNTGSNSTLANHLRDWKNHRQTTQLLGNNEGLPEELIGLMKGLWQSVLTNADDKIKLKQQEFEATVNELKVQLETLNANHTRLQQQYRELQKENEILNNSKLTLDQRLKQLEQDNLVFKIAEEKVERHLHEKQIRIDELHKLNLQAQANLEHYREASREQRLQEQQRFEQTQIQLEHRLQQQHQELINLDQQKKSLEQEHAQVCYEKERLQQQCEKLIAQTEDIKLKLAHTEKAVIQHVHGEQHWQSQYQTLQQKIESEHTKFLNLQTEMAVIMQQHTEIQIKINTLTEQNQQLAHDKWILGQEKAQLYGQLKQLET